MEYEQGESAIDKNGYPRNYDPNSESEVVGTAEDEGDSVRQNWGYFSIFFSIVQTIILALMMWQCGVDPMTLSLLSLFFLLFCLCESKLYGSTLGAETLCRSAP
jgi:hypothetical protein